MKKRLILGLFTATFGIITFVGFLLTYQQAIVQAAAVEASWENASTIRLGSDTYTDPTPSDSTRVYYNGGDSSASACRSVIQFISPDNKTAKLYRRSLTGPAANPCRSTAVDDVNLANSEVLAAAPGGGSSEEAPSCESLGAIAWLICPIISSLDGALNWVDTQIARLLEIDGTIYDNEQMRKAWGTIRNIAYIVLVPIMLVMVVGTAIGSSMFDAYTVKKALPRMVTAIIFIALSYTITTFLITLANAIGAGTLGLFTAPFNTPGVTVSTLSLADLFGPSALTGILLLPKLLAFGIGMALVVWFFGGTILLFIGAAFLILLLRQLFIVGLILIAPLAILAWIFPGNDKLWKSWWSLFSKLLIMFPLIMGLIAVGRIFAVIIDADRGGALQGAALAPIMKLAAYTLPYAFIPFTFKFAGGVFATVAGIANDKEKGLFDRQRKAREHKRERLAGGNVFRSAPEGSLRSRLNRAGETGMNIRKAGLNPRQMRTNMRTALNDSAEAEVGKFMDSDSFKTWSGDDAKVAAARFDSREDIAAELARFDGDRFGGEGNRARREEAVSQILRSKRDVGNETFQRARVRAQAKTGTGYQYTDANGQTQFDATRMLDDINAAYGSDRNGAGKALAEMRTSLAQSGQVAGLAGYGTWAASMEGRYNGTMSEERAHNDIMDDTINSVAPGQAVYGKPASAAAVGAAHARRIQAIANGITAGTHTQDDLNTAVAGAAGIYDAMSQASPQNASAMANELMGVQLNAPVLTRTYQNQGGAMVTENLQSSTVREYIQALAQANGNAEFLNRRRELSAAALSQAQAIQQAQAAAGGGGLPGAPPPAVGP